ncbi:MAG TPA: BamA/TamA family outer membrane protein [Longimicrobiales bacterium]|nr:BamA/TamA family outer membrane protein [Longimicrobiales bacterium]
MNRRLAIAALAGALVAVPAAPAQAQYFGRNKVQYRTFDFKIIKTEHFDVYYYPQEREAALDAARMVERSYARLSRLLQHEFRERKPLIVYASHADFQQTNALAGFLDEGTGGVTEPIKNRMILPFTGSYADFEHVLTHELVHAFQFDIIFRRGMMTDASPFGERLPLWFMEGMAEYLSIGRIDPLTVAWLRDAVLSGYMRDIAAMSQRDDYLSYRFGQSLWQYIGAKWGDEVVGILLQKTPRMGLERAFRTTLGLTLEELSREWLTQVRTTYLPQVADYQRPDRFAAKLTRHNKLEDPWYLAPALSPDGKNMVFLSQQGGFSFDLWLADAETGQIRRRLIRAERSGDLESLRFMNSSASFSPDGRYIAFSAQTGGSDDLYIYDVRSRRMLRKLRFKLNGVTSPSWSPDGRRIVFSGNDGGITDLFVTDLNGHVRRLTDDRYTDMTPAWSPDGKTIAFTTDRGEDTDFATLRYGNYRVALVHLADGRIERLPHQETGKNHNPAWSPDGRQLLWVSDRTGNNDLYLYDLTTQEFSRLTSVLSGVIAIGPLSPVVSWARDGRLAFVYFEQAGYNIYTVADPRTLPRMPVSALVAGPGGPTGNMAHAPDGSHPPAGGDGNGATDGIGTSSVAAPVAADTAPMAPQRRLSASYYRSGSEFRPSAASPTPASPAGSGPISVVALMDSAALALPDTGSFQLRDYHVKFTPDMVGRPTVGAQVGGYYGNGLYGGSFIALSDMLGNHNIFMAGNVNGSLSDAEFLGAYSFLKRRANLTLAFEQVPLYRYYGGGYLDLDFGDGAREAYANVFVRDVMRMGAATMSYPFSPFRRLELGGSATYYKTDVLYRGLYVNDNEPVNETLRLQQFAYLQPFGALVFDNTLFGWTGPIYGRRYRLQASRTLGDFSYNEALIDVRNYANYKRKLVFASQFFGLLHQGGDADRFSLYWGGPYLIRGYDGGSFDPNGAECQASAGADGQASVSGCPARDQLIGSSAAFMNLELRFPVISELQLGFLGAFPPVDAVAFFDGGLAWSRNVCVDGDFTQLRCTPENSLPVHVVWRRKPGQDPLLYRQPLYSWGIGLRMNVFYTVLRLDYAIPMNRPGRHGVFSLSFGPSF